MVILYINYGTSYIYKITNIENSYNFNLTCSISNYITINKDTGILIISNNLYVGKYDLFINYIENDILIDNIITIIIQPIIIYDVSNVLNTCILTPILNPPINLLQNCPINNFTLDICSNNITINYTNGIINLNNLLLGMYSFNVTWNLNNILSSYYINFIIQPQFYYLPNESTIRYGTTSYSNIPIIIPNMDNYTFKSNCIISSSGILYFNNYSVGYHKIKVILYINNINISTYYNLYVLPYIYYNNYICNAYTISYLSPIIYTPGCTYCISGYTPFFYIDINTGIITINGPTNIYNIIVNYTKNNISAYSIVQCTINAIIIYNNITTYSNIKTYSDIPYSNEILDGVFLLDISNNIYIDSNTGIIEFSYLIPNIYNILIYYIKNNCITQSYCQIKILPIFNIITNSQIIYYNELLENVYFEILPNDYSYSLLCDNKNINIYNNYICLNNIKNVGNYSINLTLNMNNQIIYTKYSFIILPNIIYNSIIEYSDYNTIFISNAPLIIPNLYNHIFTISTTISDIIINNNTGIITAYYLPVGKYIFDIYNNNNFITSFTIIIKPIIYCSIQNIIYSNTTISNIICFPENGILNYDIINLNVGLHMVKLEYNYNNIYNTITTTINIVKKQLKLNYHVQTKIYDSTSSSIIFCLDISNILIYGEFENPNIGYNKLIIIKEFIIPEELQTNYYIEIPTLSGNIIPKILIPEIIAFNKIYDGTFTTNIEFNLIPNIVLSYKSFYTNKNVGLQNIIINNIILETSNYVLSSDIYTISSYILPKNTYITFIGNDKIYDNTISAVILFKKIEGLIKPDTIYFKNILAIFTNKNVGLRQINIIKYEIYGYNYNNYLLYFNPIYAYIKKLDILIYGYCYKIFDKTSKANIKFTNKKNIKVLSYNATYNNYNVGINKIINVNNIVLHSMNYNPIIYKLFGTIIPKFINFDFSGNNKIYDGTTICLGNYILYDDIEYTYNANFIDINVGINKQIIITNLKIINSINYKIKNIYTNLPSIYKKELYIICHSINKIYDKKLTAYIKIISLSGIIGNDSVNIISLNANYDNYNSGINKIIHIDNIILDNINYYINNTTCIGSIFPKEIILSCNPIEKIYDNTTTAPITNIYIKNILYNDNIYIESIEGAYETNNASNNIIINIYNIKLNGSSINNYICKDFKILGSIYKKYLYIIFTAENKEFTNNLIPTINYTIPYDNTISILSYNASYLSIKCGKQYIIISDIIINGLNALNYNINNYIITSTILPKYINIDFSANNKIYDGTNIVQLLYNTTFPITFTAYYIDSNIGYKQIYINNIQLINNNYTTISNIIIYGTIVPKKIFITPYIFKIYDNTNIGKLSNIYTNFKNIYIVDYKCSFCDINVHNNIPIQIYDIKLNNTNYIIDNFIIYGHILPKFYKPIFIIKDKIYDCSNIVYISNIISKLQIISYDIYYLNYTVGLQDVIIKNIVFINKNYYTHNFIIKSYIYPKLLEINFIIKPKIYDKLLPAIIDKYNILNTDESIIILSYNAYYNNVNCGLQKISISNIIINTNNYYTSIYYTYSNINQVVLELNFKNLNKIYDKSDYCYIEIDTINNIVDNDDITINHFNSKYKSSTVNNNIPIYITNIILNNNINYNYIVNDYIIFGNIISKNIECLFKYTNNTIISSINGIIPYDNVYIFKYNSYKKNNKIYIDNIILEGIDKNNYNIKDILYIL